MDGVVDASMQGYEATQHRAVSGIDNGIHLQTRDVALPHLQTRKLRLNDAFSANCQRNSSSCLRKSSAGAGLGGRTFIRARINSCLLLRSAGTGELCPVSVISQRMTTSRLSSLLAVSLSHISVALCMVDKVIMLEDGRRGRKVIIVYLLDIHLEMNHLVIAGIEP